MMWSTCVDGAPHSQHTGWSFRYARFARAACAEYQIGGWVLLCASARGAVANGLGWCVGHLVVPWGVSCLQMVQVL